MVGTPGIEPDVEVVPHRGVALRHDAQRETGVRVSHAGPPLRRVIPGPHRPEGEGEDCPILNAKRDRQRLRSEEHTSELQSRLHLVCRLLLEKKNQEPTAEGSYLLLA